MRIVEKGWGNEHIWVSNEHYCSKLLKFNDGAKFSMHFHKDKIETWMILSGEFIIRYIDTSDAEINSINMKKGDVWHNDPLFPHQIICLKKGVILEVSTKDSINDNYRVEKGDSQR